MDPNLDFTRNPNYLSSDLPTIFTNQVLDHALHSQNALYPDSNNPAFPDLPSPYLPSADDAACTADETDDVDKHINVDVHVDGDEDTDMDDTISCTSLPDGPVETLDVRDEAANLTSLGVPLGSVQDLGAARPNMHSFVGRIDGNRSLSDAGGHVSPTENHLRHDLTAVSKQGNTTPEAHAASSPLSTPTPSRLALSSSPPTLSRRINGQCIEQQLLPRQARPHQADVSPSPIAKTQSSTARSPPVVESTDPCPALTTPVSQHKSHVQHAEPLHPSITDPLTNQPYEPVDADLLYMITSADPIWALKSIPGTLYYLSLCSPINPTSLSPSDFCNATLQTSTAGNALNKLNFNLDCRDPSFLLRDEGDEDAKRAEDTIKVMTYSRLYLRWLVNAAKPEVSPHLSSQTDPPGLLPSTQSTGVSQTPASARHEQLNPCSSSPLSSTWCSNGHSSSDWMLISSASPLDDNLPPSLPQRRPQTREIECNPCLATVRYSNSTSGKENAAIYLSPLAQTAIYVWRKALMAASGGFANAEIIFQQYFSRYIAPLQTGGSATTAHATNGTSQIPRSVDTANSATREDVLGLRQEDWQFVLKTEPVEDFQTIWEDVWPLPDQGWVDPLVEKLRTQLQEDAKNRENQRMIRQPDRIPMASPYSRKLQQQHHLNLAQNAGLPTSSSVALPVLDNNAASSPISKSQRQDTSALSSNSQPFSMSRAPTHPANPPATAEAVSPLLRQATTNRSPHLTTDGAYMGGSPLAPPIFSPSASPETARQADPPYAQKLQRVHASSQGFQAPTAKMAGPVSSASSSGMLTSTHQAQQTNSFQANMLSRVQGLPRAEVHRQQVAQSLNSLAMSSSKATFMRWQQGSANGSTISSGWRNPLPSHEQNSSHGSARLAGMEQQQQHSQQQMQNLQRQQQSLPYSGKSSCDPSQLPLPTTALNQSQPQQSSDAMATVPRIKHHLLYNPLTPNLRKNQRIYLARAVKILHHKKLGSIDPFLLEKDRGLEKMYAAYLCRTGRQSIRRAGEEDSSCRQSWLRELGMLERGNGRGLGGAWCGGGACLIANPPPMNSSINRPMGPPRLPGALSGRYGNGDAYNSSEQQNKMRLDVKGHASADQNFSSGGATGRPGAQTALSNSHLERQTQTGTIGPSQSVLYSEKHPSTLFRGTYPDLKAPVSVPAVATHIQYEKQSRPYYHSPPSTQFQNGKEILIARLPILMSSPLMAQIERNTHLKKSKKGGRMDLRGLLRTVRAQEERYTRSKRMVRWESSSMPPLRVGAAAEGGKCGTDFEVNNTTQESLHHSSTSVKTAGKACNRLGILGPNTANMNTGSRNFISRIIKHEADGQGFGYDKNANQTLIASNANYSLNSSSPANRQGDPRTLQSDDYTLPLHLQACEQEGEQQQRGSRVQMMTAVAGTGNDLEWEMAVILAGAAEKDATVPATGSDANGARGTNVLHEKLARLRTGCTVFH